MACIATDLLAQAFTVFPLFSCCGSVDYEVVHVDVFFLRTEARGCSVDLLVPTSVGVPFHPKLRFGSEVCLAWKGRELPTGDVLNLAGSELLPCGGSRSRRLWFAMKRVCRGCRRPDFV